MVDGLIMAKRKNIGNPLIGTIFPKNLYIIQSKHKFYLQKITFKKKIPIMAAHIGHIYPGCNSKTDILVGLLRLENMLKGEIGGSMT